MSSLLGQRSTDINGSPLNRCTANAKRGHTCLYCPGGRTGPADPPWMRNSTVTPTSAWSV